MLGTVIVLAVAAVVVLVGLYLTVYRPPRDTCHGGDALQRRRGIPRAVHDAIQTDRPEPGRIATLPGVMEREERYACREKQLG
jgi:hypothetical protein